MPKSAASIAYLFAVAESLINIFSNINCKIDLVIIYILKLSTLLPLFTAYINNLDRI